jgi:hypothetical protein
MKTLILIISFSLFFIDAFSRAGLAESFFKTPGGHSICWCDPYFDNQLPVLSTSKSFVVDANKPPLFNVNKFYFYRNYVVGQSKTYFFIFDEGAEVAYLFKSREDWEKDILIRGLKPIYTQWLDLSDAPAFFTTPYYVIVILLITSAILFLFPIVALIVTKKRLGCLQYTALLFSILILGITYALNIYSF